MSDDIQSGWWRTAYVGQKVVCIEATPLPQDDFATVPFVVGQVYTIADVQLNAFMRSGVALRIDEHPDYACCAFNFRPLTTKSTDAQVAELKKLLNTAPMRQHETTRG